ncbi:hypothetical protein RCJ22_14575 [Vibrio sp. FNV 38]|nr:hypothetical protein [Vibrio sp. FNV 38]
MAAEKLTKGRIAQILVTMIVLIVAFWWRTYDYVDNNEVSKTCRVDDVCSINEELTNIQLSRIDSFLIVSGVGEGWVVLSDENVNVTQDDTHTIIDLSAIESVSLALTFKRINHSSSSVVLIDLD